MDLNNNCCKAHKLQKEKELYISNVDEFTLYKCLDCQTDWLYRKIERSWMDNLRFKEHDYEAWYVKIAPDDLQKVMNLEFEKILFNGSYVYVSTESNLPQLKIIE